MVSTWYDWRDVSFAMLVVNREWWPYGLFTKILRLQGEFSKNFFTETKIKIDEFYRDQELI